MNKITYRLYALCLALSLVACAEPQMEEKTSNETAIKAVAADTLNPLIAPWEGDYQGVPAFDKMDLAHVKDALEMGMAKSLAEIDAITANTEPATFENTIVAYENTGRDLDRVFTYWGIWRSNISSPEFREIQGEMVPKISAYSSKITQNEALFQRIKEVYESEAMANLNPVQQRVVKLTYDSFAHNGATLNAEEKKRYASINARLAELYTKFSNNVLHDEENYVVYLTKEQLGGLPDSFVNAIKAAAESRGKEDAYAITNTRSSMDPFLTYSTERDLREKVWNNYYNRGDNGDEHDNNAIIIEILKLRKERVAMLGYDNFAQWQLSNRMAQQPENAMELMQA
ncbi:MAG: M3 family peptidase, partial [Enterobacterales bacterium]|nr:M3 family peptidase [Enterobacterales bacterium]